MTDLAEHWERVYATKGAAELSWTQADPRLSMALIREAAPAGRVVDVGGGASPLGGRLLAAGYEVTVLDVSAAALERARAALGAAAGRVRWVVGDVTAGPELGAADVWHDRAVFHFLTRAADRAAYADQLRRTVRPGGHAVIATFAPDGPERCSGLPVARYDADRLLVALGEGLSLVRGERELHRTPWGATQAFHYALMRRT